MKFRELIQVLEHDGWRQVAQRGSHRQYRHPTKPGRVTVAGKPNQDIPPGTLGSIIGEGGSMSTWTVVYEQTATGWSAYVPAIPGVGVAGATHEEAEQLVSEAITLHLEGLVADGLPIPEPGGVDVGQVELPLPA